MASNMIRKTVPKCDQERNIFWPPGNQIIILILDQKGPKFYQFKKPPLCGFEVGLAWEFQSHAEAAWKCKLNLCGLNQILNRFYAKFYQKLPQFCHFYKKNNRLVSLDVGCVFFCGQLTKKFVRIPGLRELLCKLKISAACQIRMWACELLRSSPGLIAYLIWIQLLCSPPVAFPLS